MEEIQQAKQGLLVYLEANRQYIEEKVYNEFNVECIQLKTLETLNLQKMKQTIKDIFDFGDNKVYEYFFSHLDSNISQYIADQYKAKAIASFYVIDVQKLTDIVKFCINHGFDFAAAKLKDQNSAVKAVPERQPEQERKVQPKDQFAHVKPRISTFLDPAKIPEKREFKLEKYSMPETKVQPRYLSSIPKIQTMVRQQQPLTVNPLEEAYLQEHRKSIRQRLQKLFNFYCVQQQSLGQRPTFDHIKGQGESMNLGGFMQFCQYTRVFLCKQMPKQALLTLFKKVSQGKTYIDFDDFQSLVTLADQKYLQEMGNDPVNNPIPTYEARLLLNQPAKLGELKKHRNLIFGTRAKEGREFAKLSSQPKYGMSSQPKYGIRELTAHSGRFSSDLTLDLKSKALLRERKVVRPRRAESVDKRPVNLADLKKLKLPKLNWIQQDQDEYLMKPE